MSATSSAMPSSTTAPFGKGQQTQGISVGSFVASLAVAAAVFAGEFILFVLLQTRIRKIYLPKTFLVPGKELMDPPPPGLLGWIKPIFQTSTSKFIEKCGLDAYFFLRFLRTLLRIFIPLALFTLPILLPINYHGGRGSDFAVGKYNTQKNVTGLDQLGWGNIRPEKTDRYWAHLIMAVLVVVYTCYIFFDELRGYVRMRQAYLTSPQHRLRASATTVLVTSIPRKWLSVEALDALYDVFPGGVRNIWINRNFDDLQDKVKLRNKWAMKLESCQTDLIKKAKKSHLEALEKEAKKAGNKTSTSQKKKELDESGDQMADDAGISSGNPHQVHHTLHEEVRDDSASTSSSEKKRKPRIPIPVIGTGIGAVAQGVENVGRGVFGGFRKVGKNVDDRLAATQGFVSDEEAKEEVRAASADSRDEVGDGVAPGYFIGSPVSPQSEIRDEPTLRAVSNSSQRATSDGPAMLDRDHSTDQTGAVELSTLPNVTEERSANDPYHADVDPRVDSSPTTAAASQPAELENTQKQSPSWMFWRKKKAERDDSPQPFRKSEDKAPLKKTSSSQTRGQSSTAEGRDTATSEPASKKEGMSLNPLKVLGLRKEGDVTEGHEYPAAFNEDYEDDEGEPEWKKYLKDSDRDTMRVPIGKKPWVPSLPLVGQKVDTIHYCRREVARLNVEIEYDQQHPENFPLMNSAFVQFHHQVAAHMACQSVSHHLPKQMAPRTVEISPMDVVWDNMSMKWWERYVRTGVCLIIVIGLVIGWAIPVSFTGLLSQLTYLEQTYPWLAWIRQIPVWLLSIIQGVLPAAFIGLLMVLLPIVLRALAKQQGIVTGMGIELSVQQYYFAFSFVQLFLVVSISSGLFSVISQLLQEPQSAPSLLAANLPKASNYFFSYLLLQAFSVSAGALVQIGALVGWFILAPLLDNTARKKWRRVTQLPNMKWGTFFPVYTNLACIGIIYSVISPLIMIFNIITFSLFWMVYRYDTLYVRKFRFDTGGLLFPTAINQLFTGLYVMEICLIGLFFLVRDQNGNVACKGQAITMIIITIFTLIYQYLLYEAFSPLYRYLPITLEDDAAARDEEFALANDKKKNEREEEDYVEMLEERERRERQAESEAEEIELKQIEERRKSRLHPLSGVPEQTKEGTGQSRNQSPADYGHFAERSRDRNSTSRGRSRGVDPRIDAPKKADVEAQGRNTLTERLFGGIHDEIEDLSPEERDVLVHRAFQHSALRAKRPVIWIPRDDLGISNDEIHRTRKLSKHIWISNQYTGLDAKCRVIYKRSPPDFSEVDMIDL